MTGLEPWSSGAGRVTSVNCALCLSSHVGNRLMAKKITFLRSNKCSVRLKLYKFVKSDIITLFGKAQFVVLWASMGDGKPYKKNIEGSSTSCLVSKASHQNVSRYLF